MRRKATLVGAATVLFVLALGVPSWAATVRVTDTGLEPETVTVNRGEEVVWLDFTLSRTAQLTLRNGMRERATVGVADDEVARATFVLPGAYEYSAYAGVGGLQPRTLNGKIVVK
jgi:plastocyanin